MILRKEPTYSMSKTLIAQIKTNSNLAIWEPASLNTNLAEQRCLTLTSPGEFDVFIEVKNNETKRLIIKRSKAPKITGFKHKRNREINFSSLVVIGDESSHQDMALVEGNKPDCFEKAIALMLNGKYSCDFSDFEISLKRVV